MRKILLILHRYLGLLLGLLFTLQGLTGSLLVFDHAIDEALHPEFLLSTPTSAPVPLAQVVEAARAAAPAGAKLRRIDLPRHAQAVHTVRLTGAEGERLEVTVDPYTGEATSLREWGAQGMSWVYRLHYALLGGDTGHTLVGISGIVLLLMSLGGLYLWWPRQGRWRAVLKLRLGKGALPLHYDLHRLAGALITPVLVVVSFSGIYIVFSSAFHRTADALFEPTLRPPAVIQAPAAWPLDADAAVARARALFPEAVPKRLFLPQDDELYRVTLRQPGEPRRSGGLTDVWISQQGQVEKLRDYAGGNPAERFLAWLFPLHNGEALGLPGRIVVAAAGLAPALLFITGLSLWAIKRRRRGGR